jgi:hypothetical protein
MTFWMCVPIEVPSAAKIATVAITMTASTTAYSAIAQVCPESGCRRLYARA